MPSAWIHATIDLIAFGKPYFDFHKDKDSAHKTLGTKHRDVNHEYLKQFGKLWTLSNPFPSEAMESIQRLLDIVGEDAAEEQQVYYTHDCIDKVWDGLSHSEREYWEGFSAWLLLNPSILRDWAGVDVLNGKIHRVVEGQEIWEDCPELKSKYNELLHYVKTVVRKGEILQHMLELYGSEVQKNSVVYKPEVENMKHEKIKEILAKHKEELKERYKVKEIGIFGSYAKREHRKKSDIDILVEFEEVPGLFKFLELEDYITEILGVKVDLVRKKALREELKDRILKETVYI
ncbi:MAG TPA: nucleotidyltransferase family protein [Candidatus Tripitaka californicus]|uniref:nucleotidyltransferase family protein n=1 Tax=Candidatus Tripitaka californicus TaxID=3367616 RepID=UPI004028F80D